MNESPATAPVAAAPSTAEQPLFEGMGSHSRPVTTRSTKAQRYFDQGMALLHGFNYAEARRSFEQAALYDPECAMAHFGVALASGPHINNPTVPPHDEQVAVEALARARAAAGADPVERALVDALTMRHAVPQPEDRAPLDQAYADAMGRVWAEHPDDADVGTWYAEALMDLHPWDLWTAEGTPKEGAVEIVDLLERVLVLDPQHPLALHLYIHAVEASDAPERAEAAADTLRDLVPGHGHLLHMPSHIDVLTGRWSRAIETNQRAHAADLVYLELTPEQGFYRLYMAHNLHMLAYAAMMVGQRDRALEAMKGIVASIPPQWAADNPEFADGYSIMPVEVMMRFGQWEDILALPAFADTQPFSQTLLHYARGVSFAATQRPTEARAEYVAMQAARQHVDEHAAFGNNTMTDIIDVAQKLLEGEVLYREGKIEAGLDALREAVRREDALRYDEPPGWIQPIRHALGAALLEQKRATEAEAVFRRDLQQRPENGWALWGLARSLRLQGRDADAAGIDARFERVWADADVPLHSSCMCLPGV